MQDTDTIDALPDAACAVRFLEWGVIDGSGRVTQCPSEQDAREYQRSHGGELVNRATIHTIW